MNGKESSHVMSRLDKVKTFDQQKKNPRQGTEKRLQYF